MDIPQCEPPVINQIVEEYGYWKSPISSEKAAEGDTKIINVVVDGKTIYWNEQRPANEGRYALVKCTEDGNISDVTPPEFNARSGVHEYGGGAFTVKNDTIYATNFDDHKVYVKQPGESYKPLTTGGKKLGTRFGDMHVTKYGIVAVGEEHRSEKDVENFLALINPTTGEYKKIATGYDFFSSPALSPDEKQIAYICWNHPEMPWTNTKLILADINEDGSLSNQKELGDGRPEAFFQPQWSSDGKLYVVTDRNEWWNIYRYNNGQLKNISNIDAEVGRPLWLLQRSTYAFINNKILFTYLKNGLYSLGLLDPKTGKWEKLDYTGTVYEQLRTGNGFVAYVEKKDIKSGNISKIDANFNQHICYSVKKDPIDEGYKSKGKHITFTSANGRKAHGFFYQPKNKDFKAPKESLPPLVVMIHGGPTSHVDSSFDLKKQYWTSQGFAILDVNYGGSTGYGRKYRMSLNDNWGIVDVEDCIYGAQYLVEKNLVDKNKLFIRGGSAGGFTTLAVLAFHNTFKGGANYYGVADLPLLIQDTHKFESRYLDSLLGEYPTHEKRWKERSPIYAVDNLKDPLITFQGTEDLVVPQNQSEMIYNALQKNHVKSELHLYEGEQHGFRQKKNIADSLEKEANFYREVMSQ